MTTSDLKLLSVEEISNNLAKLSDWNLEDSGKSIDRNFKFENFKQVIEFVNRVADLAEQEGHHPNMRIYGYNNLEIKLTTHTVGGLTEKDFKVAEEIDLLNSND